MRDPDRGDAARALGAHVVQLDVTDQASVDAAIAALPELDVLVNNAGILGTVVRRRRPHAGRDARACWTRTSSASSA